MGFARQHERRSMTRKDGKRDEFSVRAIKRGLDVLQAINRGGAMRLIDISRATGLPYPTVFRVVETLIDVGMVEAEPGRRRYRPTALVQTLSLGFREDLALVSMARPHIVALCKEVGWPVTIATRIGNNMIVRDSTHKLTTLTFSDYAPGYALPLLECSVGKAYVAFCSDEEREIIISSIQQLDDEPDKMARLILRDEDGLISDVRRKGYASHAYNQYTANPGKTSSLGVPIFIEGQFVGALGLVFFSSAISVPEAAARYVEKMKATAVAIGEGRLPADEDHASAVVAGS